MAKSNKNSKDSHDSVNRPKHYTKHPSGVECIQITEHMNFCLGNALKYIWRAELKNGIEDLQKAAWYIAREISNRKVGKQMKTKKPRKPLALWEGDYVCFHPDRIECGGDYIFMNLHEYKELHSWLGKAIEYLEAKEKKI